MCVSNVGCPPGIVNVFDSLPNCSIKSITLSLQVAVILHSTNPNIKLCFINTQRQMGGSDCGLLAVVFAISICHGFDPSLCAYGQEKMREHLKISFEMEVLNPFPPSSIPFFSKFSKVIATNTIPVYCLCRLPWVKEGKHASDLVQCDSQLSQLVPQEVRENPQTTETKSNMAL